MLNDFVNIDSFLIHVKFLLKKKYKSYLSTLLNQNKQIY